MRRWGALRWLVSSLAKGKSAGAPTAGRLLSNSTNEATTETRTIAAGFRPPGRNVLDNSVIVFTAEAGHGLQLNDASSQNQTHSVENMVLLVPGRAGGLSLGDVSL